METNLFENRDALVMAGRPISDPPPRDASYEERAEWSARYVAWYLPQIEPDHMAADVDETHLYRIEFDYCVLDPETYERQTREELAAPAVVH